MLISHFIHPNTFYFGFKEFIFLDHFLFLKLFNGIKIVYLLTVICFENIFSPFYCFNYGVTDAETKMSKVTPLSDRRGRSENWVIDWLRRSITITRGYHLKAEGSPFMFVKTDWKSHQYFTNNNKKKWKSVQSKPSVRYRIWVFVYSLNKTAIT